jgi:hypothetical protein
MGVLALILYYCNKNKLSDYEKGQRMLRDQQYVLSKIRYYQEDKKVANQTSLTDITNLPFTTA